MWPRLDHCLFLHRQTLTLLEAQFVWFCALPVIAYLQFPLSICLEPTSAVVMLKAGCAFLTCIFFFFFQILLDLCFDPQQQLLHLCIFSAEPIPPHLDTKAVNFVWFHLFFFFPKAGGDIILICDDLVWRQENFFCRQQFIISIKHKKEERI